MSWKHWPLKNEVEKEETGRDFCCQHLIEKKKRFSWIRPTGCFTGSVKMKLYILAGSQETPPVQAKAMKEQMKTEQ